MAGFAHIYAFGDSECTFLVRLTGRHIHNLEDHICLSPDSFNHDRWRTLTCHKFPRFAYTNDSGH